ncbi:MAG: serine hydrolase [Dysgonamonadaceae bacterium]|jgi:beta-glucosidase-like glycosyl hydrolase/CubicO group peptidase (beta-lactamase class C family)|nr:serine hydrolase [Dysgonamonadaceae bacterium]
MNKIILSISFLSLFTCCLSAKNKPALYERADPQVLQQWVDSVYATMSLDEKIGQLFMPLADSDASGRSRMSMYIKEQKVGGFLFSKGTLRQQAEATNFAQSISKIPLLISLDGEWGLAMRLSDAMEFPRNMMLGAIQNDSLLYLYGKEIARQCREMGIHINFAPSLDVNSNPDNPVIGSRSFGENAQNVAGKGIAYSQGLEDSGVLSVAKHFPGHGDTADDSHKTLPTIAHSAERLDSIELYPFAKYIEAGLSGIMIAHLNVPALQTDGYPSSLSPHIGEKLLKEKYGFSGLIFTDGMAMKGVTNQSDMSVRAILAGNDIVLGVINQKEEFDSVKKAVENGTISDSLLNEKVKKILAYKYILMVQKNTPITVSGLTNRINTPYTQWLKQKLYNESVTLLKNESELLPVKQLDKTRIASVAIGTSRKEPFQEWLNRYADVKTFQVQAGKLADIEKKLEDFDLVIFSVHQKRYSESPDLVRLVKKKNSVLVFFASPYDLKNDIVSTQSAKAVLLAYDNSENAQSAAAQAVFGGIAVSGKIPVSAGNFASGTGVNTLKTRLAYQLPEEVGIASSKLDDIEKIATEGIRQKAYPGCYVMVIKDGVVIYDRPFGNLEYGKSLIVSENTVYDLASVTKVTATLPAVMKLYDEKKIRLQNTISTFVFGMKSSDKANITIRDALFHESGLTPFIPYYMSAIDESSYDGEIFSNRRTEVHTEFYAGAWGRNDYKFKSGLITPKPDEKHNMPIADGMYMGKQMHDILLNDVIGSKLRPRGRYAYSCLNFMLLKEMVENISKEDLNTFVQKNFYKKLGMPSTTFLPLRNGIPINNIAPTENDPFFRKQQIRGYVHDEGAALFGGISGNAGLFSDANDLAKLYYMFLNGGEYGGERYLSESTVRLFTTAKSSISRRGLGFDKPNPSDTNLSPCSPQTPVEVYGHTGFTGTAFWIDPVNNMIYIFLSNRVYPNRAPNPLSSLNIRERIQEEIYNAMK